MLKKLLIFVSFTATYFAGGPLAPVVGGVAFIVWLSAIKHMGPVKACIYAWLWPFTIWHFIFCRMTGRPIGSNVVENMTEAMSYLQPKICVKCRTKVGTLSDTCAECGGEMVWAHEDPKS